MSKTNVFTRLADELEINESKDLCDYTSTELVAYVLNRYPQDPVGAVDRLLANLKIGSLLYKPTITILEGMGYVKRN